MSSRFFRTSSCTTRTAARALFAAAIVWALGLAGAVVPLVVGAPLAAADIAVQLVGHGFGHGRGMGQWGAQGYAQNFGWNAGQILDHYYGGTTIGLIDDNAVLGVRLMAQDGRDIVVTSGAGFTVPGVGHVDGGRGVRIHWTGSVFQTSVAFTSCAGNEVPGYHPIYTGGQIVPDVQDPGDNINLMLTICNEDGAGNNISYRGLLRVLADAEGTHTVNSLQYWQYLRGTVPRESPSSWQQAALQAQSVAARSVRGCIEPVLIRQVVRHDQLSGVRRRREVGKEHRGRDYQLGNRGHGGSGTCPERRRDGDRIFCVDRRLQRRRHLPPSA